MRPDQSGPRAAEPGSAGAGGASAGTAGSAAGPAGVEANARITAGAGLILLLMLAAEGVTIPLLGPLLSWHILIGVALIPPLLVKLASTGYRFARYYTRDPAYRGKGPPRALLRLLGPFVVVLSVLVVGSGLALLFVPAGFHQTTLFVHKASFVLWFAAMTIHVLGHVAETARVAPRDWYGRARRDISGASARQWLMIGSVVAGGALALAFVPQASHYHRRGDAPGTRPLGSLSRGTGVTPSTSTSASTPATRPPPEWPASFGVGLRRITLTDSTRPTLSYATTPPSEVSPHRVIAVEVRYPTAEDSPTEVPGAAPEARFGPFPVIVFASGYAAMPDTYRPMLDAWVRAGFVVVAPVFPVTNYYAWVREGEGSAPENDMVNQPGDIAFVVTRLASLDRTRSSWLDSLLDMSRLGLAGQSDGATAVAGLVWAAYFHATYDAMPDKPQAVAVLSGAPFQTPYNAPEGRAPALLAAESDTDYCNPTQRATALYDLTAPLVKAHWFLTFEGASHLDPYAGVAPWAPVAAAATTGFFRVELDAGLPEAPQESLGALSDASDVRGVAVLHAGSTMYLTPTGYGDCGEPTPEPLGGA